MLRLILSIFLVIALTGASAAAVAHDLNHDAPLSGHHADAVEITSLAGAEQALADCCDATGGMGAASCLGDLIAMSSVRTTLPQASKTEDYPQARADLSGLIAPVPTGPPKV